MDKQVYKPEEKVKYGAEPHFGKKHYNKSR